MFDFRWLKRNKGQGMVEYILIIAVVVGVVFFAYQKLGNKVKTQFSDAADKVATADTENTKAN